MFVAVLGENAGSNYTTGDPDASSVGVFGVFREFGKRPVVKNLNLEVEAGEIHGLLGPNGAGKTTVLRMVTGLLAPTAGTVVVAGGDPINRLTRAAIGWVPASDRSFYLRLNGLENLSFFGRLHGMARADAVAASKTWITRVGLEHALTRPVRMYSHGMVKRLLMARALMCQPRVLVVDEATHDLDPQGADLVKTIVRDVSKAGVAVLWATQRIRELRGFADSVTVLGVGDVKFSGSVDELAAHSGGQTFLLRFDTNPPSDLIELEYGMAERIDASERWRLTLPNDASLTDALVELGSRGQNVISCSEERVDVERAFLRLTETDT